MLTVFEVLGIVVLFLIAVILLWKIFKESGFIEFFINFFDYFSGESFTVGFLIFSIVLTIIFIGLIIYQIKLMQP